MLVCAMMLAGLLLANVMVALGGLLVSGPDAARRYLLSSKRWVSTAFMLIGITLIWSSRTLCFFGFCIEVLGFLNLFGPFVSNSLRWMLPLMPSSVSKCVTAVLTVHHTLIAKVKGLFRWPTKAAVANQAGGKGLDESDDDD
jgi:hypothetical protein